MELFRIRPGVTVGPGENVIIGAAASGEGIKESLPFVGERGPCAAFPTSTERRMEKEAILPLSSNVD